MHNTLDTINQRVHYLQANNIQLISQTLMPMTSSSDQRNIRSRTYMHCFFLCSSPAAIPWHPPLLIPSAAFATRPPPYPVAVATHCCTKAHSLSHLPTHSLSCALFLAQPPRPPGYPDPDPYYRYIFFPKDETSPRIAWLEYKQTFTFRPSQSNIDALIQGPYERYGIVRSGREDCSLRLWGERV